MMLLSNPSTRCLLATLICSQLIGCAQLQTPPEERIDQIIIQSFKDERSIPGNFVVHGLTIQNERIRASIQREELCYTVSFNEIEHQKVRTFEAENVALDIAGGLILGAGAGVLFGLAPTMSDEIRLNADGEEMASYQQLAVGSGIVLALSSLWALGNGVLVYSKTGDRTYDTPWTTLEEQSQSAHRTCGTTDVSAGIVQIFAGERVLGQSKFSDGRLDLDLRSGSRACLDASILGQTVKISVQPDNSTESVVVTELNLDDCIHAIAARQRLDLAQKQLETFSTPIEFARVAIHLNEANALLEKLPTEDPDRARLTTRHAELHASTASTSGKLLDDSLLAFRQTLTHASAQSAVESARASLELSYFVEGARLATWERVYGDFVKASQSNLFDSHAALEKLLEQDESTRSCLVASLSTEAVTSCPAELDRELVGQTFAPIQTRMISSLDQQTNRLNSAARQLEKKITEANFDALAHQFDLSEQTLELCNPGLWAETLQSSCAQLNQSRDQAVRIARASQTALEQIRIKNTAKAWRGQFAQCRKVAQASQAFRAVQRCDASCQKIRARVIDDYNQLRNFSVEDATWDTETLTKVRSECREAGCPSCP